MLKGRKIRDPPGINPRSSSVQAANLLTELSEITAIKEDELCDI